jgi:triacylglycerol lipase
MLDLASSTIIFVHGIFGWGPNEITLPLRGTLSYWGEALGQFDNNRFNTFEVKCGPVSSFHDRACELYAQIKGGDFIYDASRANRRGEDDGPKRARVSKLERPTAAPGLLPDWSSRNKVIFIAHSAGLQTCLTLQRLLAENYWGDDSSADWIEAIISVAGVINGSTLTYMFCDPMTGVLTGNRRRMIGATVEAVNFLTGGASAPQTWLEQWNDLDEFVDHQDNLAYGLTLKACSEANQKFATFGPNPNTYYLSLVTGMPAERAKILNVLPWAFGALQYSEMNDLLKVSAAYQDGLKEFDTHAKPIPDWGATLDLKVDAWHLNDGAVSRISQRFPFTHGVNATGEEGIFSRAQIDKGKWYFEHVENVVGVRFDHLDPVFGPKFNKPERLREHRLLHQRLNALFGGGNV